MNSPGNDLEGIAGQVAAGCNLILFVTGNGSITNFPFVPTLKITTTTRRHQLLIHEMDINAGRYLDGESMRGARRGNVRRSSLATASGRTHQGRARRPLAGFALAQLAADRHLAPRRTARARRAGRRAAATRARPPVAGQRERCRRCASSRTDTGFATERVGLVLPTSFAPRRSRGSRPIA